MEAEDQPVNAATQFFDPWEPPPAFTAAPADPVLQQRIIKLAEFAIRNGPQFIDLMKAKQKENPEYAFLFGSEGYDFYRWVLYCSLYNHPHDQPLPGTETTYTHAAEHAVPENSTQNAVPSPAWWSQGLASTLPPELSQGFAQVLEALTGSKESIKSSQSWFMQCAAYAAGMAYMMASRVVHLEGVEKQLHVVYLANDILFKSLANRPIGAESSSDPVSRAFQPVLGAMLAAIHRQAGAAGEVTQRLEKILTFWGERSVYCTETIQSLKDAMNNGDPHALLKAAALPAPESSSHAPAGAASTPSADTSAPMAPQPPHVPAAGAPTGDATAAMETRPPHGHPLAVPPAAAMPAVPPPQPPSHGHMPMASQAPAPWQQPRQPMPPPGHPYHPGMNIPLPGQPAQPPGIPPWQAQAAGGMGMGPPGHPGVPLPPGAAPQGMWYPPPGAPPNMLPGPHMGQPMFMQPHGAPGMQGHVPPHFPMHTPMPAGVPPPGMPRAPAVPQPPAAPYPTPAAPRPVSSFSFPPGLIPELCRDKSKHTEPYGPLSPTDIEAAGLPAPPVKDAYLRSRLDRFHAEINEYRPGMMRCDVDEKYRDRKDLVREPSHSAGPPGKSGMQNDGSYAGDGDSGGQYAGLGSHRPRAEPKDDDMYNSYRKIRSGVYHETLSKAQAAAAALVASVPR